MIDYWWGNNTRIDCVLRTDDVTIMTSLSTKFFTRVCNKIPYKTFILDFLDLKN